MAKTKKSSKKIHRSITGHAKVGSHFRLLMAMSVAVLLFIAYITILRNRPPSDLSSFRARPYNVVKPLVRPNAKPQLLVSPANIKKTYNLTNKGNGAGTIAIIIAFDDPNIEADLGVFSSQYSLAPCTTANSCLEKHKMVNNIATSQDWAIESALDVEWSHAVAPGAKILLVEAKSDSGTDLLNAVNYARSRRDVVAVSMSWGGSEFPSETNYESAFTSSTGAVFFAASGDNGNGTSWPAVSANVISVGGTKVNLSSNGTFISEVAWAGSGGGPSQYIREPSRQLTYGVTRANNKRATPDVSYNADPNSGYPVYSSVPYGGSAGWFQVGGTSAGSPQWAGIAALSGGTLTANKLYTDAKQAGQVVLRDIISGTNGTCGLYCTTTTGFDYITGLGSPLTVRF